MLANVWYRVVVKLLVQVVVRVTVAVEAREERRPIETARVVGARIATPMRASVF